MPPPERRQFVLHSIWQCPPEFRVCCYATVERWNSWNSAKWWNCIFARTWMRRGRNVFALMNFVLTAKTFNIMHDFTAILPAFRLARWRHTFVSSSPSSSRAKNFTAVFFSYYSLVFIVICDLFSLTFILVITCTIRAIRSLEKFIKSTNWMF